MGKPVMKPLRWADLTLKDPTPATPFQTHSKGILSKRLPGCHEASGGGKVQLWRDMLVLRACETRVQNLAPGFIL